MLIRSLRFVTMLLVALVLGLSFAHVLELPAKMQYDAALYLSLQKTLYAQWGPPNVGGFLEPAAILATLILSFLLRRRRPAVWLTLGVGVALLLAFPVVFFVFVAPSNAAFLSATVASIPGNWMELRTNWETGHAIRFGLHLLALALLTLAILFEIPERATRPPHA